MSRDLVLCVDGTWNDAADGDVVAGDGSLEDVTNVYRLSQMLVDDGTQRVYYVDGLGAEVDTGPLLHWVQGAVGVGLRTLGRACYELLRAAWRPGDRVHVYAFSRGAAAARIAVGRIVTRGLGPRGEGREVTSLGLFDTVPALALPYLHWIDAWIVPVRIGDHGDVDGRRAGVVSALHLLALDDRRPHFRPQLLWPRPGIEEVWLPGAHADVGGGYRDDRGLADVALLEMALYAQACGLRTVSTHPRGGWDIDPDPLGRDHAQPFPWRRPARRLDGTPPHLHRAAVERARFVTGYDLPPAFVEWRPPWDPQP